MRKRRKRIEKLLRQALLHKGEMALALYEYELVEYIDYWYDGLLADQNEFVFVVTENTGRTAMLLISKEKELYINEAGREKLAETWGAQYKTNIELLLPMMAEELANDILSVTGVSVEGN